jgi:FdhD protein
MCRNNGEVADEPDSVERQVVRVEGSSSAPRPDRLVVEAPLELRSGGEPAIVVMRTPGHDLELARGLLLSEGLVRAADDRELVVVEDNVIEVGDGLATRPLVTSSSCGVCGKTSIAELELRAESVISDLRVPASVIRCLPDRLRAAQTVFERTGALHAAGAFDGAGQLLEAREDVGRHNAVDKLVGWAANAGRVPMSAEILCVSGRMSFEIVQKAVVAGIPVVVAVSAPTSLAVDLAERFAVTLCGFVRGGPFNVYSHATRVV